MPPVQVPGAGSSDSGGSSGDDDDFEFETHVGSFYGSSLPDHFGCLVGSPMAGFALPMGSLPRSFNDWQQPVARRFVREQDVESGVGFTFHREEAAAAQLAVLPPPPPLPPLPPLAAADTPGGAGPQVAETEPARASKGDDVKLEELPEAISSKQEQSEVVRILRLAAPLSVSNLAGYAISMIAIAAVGRLGEAPLAVVVLATSVFNVTGLSVLIGFSSAMETFCGQAYGAGRYRLVGLVLQRAMLLLTLVAAAVAVLWTQAERILLALGQDAAIAHGTGQFLLRAMPALWFTGVFEALKRYLMAQEAVRPATVVTCVALAMAPLYNWLLIYRLGFGLYGAAYAMDAMQATMACLLAAYCVARDRLLRDSPLSTWQGFSRKALTGWGQYCRFALPSVFMLCCEWSTFEVMVLMSGLLPDPTISVSVMGLCINTSGMAYMMVTGLACATSVRVSNSLGARQPEAARRATWTAWGLTMCLQTVVAVGIVLLRGSWARLFTDSQAVVERTAELLPLFALSLFGDGTNAVLQGLLRGAGKQETGAITNLISYWCCGIPLAAYLAFNRGMGLQGLWWGLVVINTVQGCIMLTLAALFDYQKQSEQAVAMLQHANARLEMEGQDPLLTPLLLGDEALAAAAVAAAAAGSGGGVCAEASSGRQSRRRGSGEAGGRRSLDAAGIKGRLKESLMRLLTEGAHVQPRRAPPGGSRRGRKAVATAAVPVP